MAYSIGTREAKETAIDLVNVVLGLCLVLAPWFLGFTGEMAATRNAWIVGAAIALIALGALFAFREWEEWVNLALGIWAIPIVVDPMSPGGVSSPHGLILFDGVCVLCSRACRFVSKRDRSGYFRFVPIQLAEGRPLAEQLGIDPQCPDSFAFVAKGQGYIKSEAVLRIARKLPHWQWTWVFHLIPRVIRDQVYDLVARNRYRWFGRREACVLPNLDRSWPL